MDLRRPRRPQRPEPHRAPRRSAAGPHFALLAGLSIALTGAFSDPTFGRGFGFGSDSDSASGQNRDSQTDTKSETETKAAGDQTNTSSNASRTQTESESVDDEPAPESATGRFGQVRGMRSLFGEHDLHVEILRPQAGRPLEVRVDGEAVDGSTAAFLMRLIRQKNEDEEAISGLARPGDEAGRGRGGGRGGARDGSGAGRGPRGGGADGGPGRGMGGGPGMGGELADTGPQRAWRGIKREAVADELGPELIDDVITVARDFDPNQYDRLVEWQSSEDPRFESQIRRLAFEFADQIEMKRRNGEMYELSVREHELERESVEIQFEIAFSNSISEEEIADYRGQLRRLHTELFNVQQDMRKRQLERMSDRLGALRERLERRLESRESIVEEQVDKIMQDVLRGK